jgi:hypothetical protein
MTFTLYRKSRRLHHNLNDFSTQVMTMGNNRCPIARHPTTRRLRSSCKAAEHLAVIKLALSKLSPHPNTCRIGWRASLSARSMLRSSPATHHRNA